MADTCHTHRHGPDQDQQMSPLALVEWPSRVAKASAGIVIAIGVVALLGWQFDLANLKAIVPGWAPKIGRAHV